MRDALPSQPEGSAAIHSIANLCFQDEKCVTGIAETEQRSREQIFPIGRRKLSQAYVDLRLAVSSRGLDASAPALLELCKRIAIWVFHGRVPRATIARLSS